MHDSDPYLGAIVHYRAQRGEMCRAAIITALWPLGRVRLHYFEPEGDDDVIGFVEPDTSSLQWESSTWHWRHQCNGGDR